MTPLESLTHCPHCGWRGPLEQVEVLGAKDYQVICPRCYGHFVAVECRTQTILEFEEDQQ